MTDDLFGEWGLRSDGPQITTPRGRVLPVRQGATAAMLKLSTCAEEQRGAALLAWWNGDGAVPVLAHRGDALLMLRAGGARELVDICARGDDATATEIICNVAQRLHRPRRAPPLLCPLRQWFRGLFDVGRTQGGTLRECATIAEALLSSPQDQRPLHGDLHHENVLDFGDLGWLAIDPKGLFGERGFDFACLFLNPDLSGRTRGIASSAQVFDQRLTTVSTNAGMERDRLLRWVTAGAGLSAAWMIESGQDAALPLIVAELGLRALR